ncbi:DNA-binding transcriptional LysR family regulator [Rhizobium sp. ERR 922]|uniref:LysR family transcriptional regulator n=1 Tax=Rhizobium dioscoreae TaxID=2653122 RepID=A0ABQ0Z4E0_9HYPH|nr:MULTISPECIES: LysR family transcriptional regulator [Rhizobium]TWB50450.1 DNA-binding transcriptional LysR family regulator [Rhizobium sp. ERR 922]TWB92830.1 DNA-binding transcriptional LysR family regulator [Rhizobium sp. ERR 942]GES42576.1 LysR family transcriptional regulator [Rhizobium dioscoreae]GES50385.1 LysR family transcriptional regulator [Rhizobium dioscoreae]GLU81854.1 LysR family transcriptional regulator [Rhizobium sp. NBRC 114257]
MTNLGDLEIFASVVATGSMSLTGRALGFSPAVISKRIKRLEDRLGTRLLQRTTRQISLTEAGQGFYDRVLAILAGLEEAEAYIAGRSSQMHGTLKISAPTSFGRMHIAPHLKSFMQAHPELALNLVLSDEFVDIVGGGFDLAIRIAELTDSSLVARRLAPVRRVLCASPAYIDAHGMPEDIDDLRRHICLPAHNLDPWRLEGPKGSLIFRPEGRLITNSSEVVREAVIAGLGIALRSTWDIGPELRDGRLVQVLPAYEGSHNVTLSAVYPSRQFLPAKVRVFIDFLAELYGPVPYWER